MKKVIGSILLSIIMVLMLVGCTEEKKSQNNNVKIGISVYDEYDTFVASVIDSFKQWASKKENETGVTITIDVVDAVSSQNTQNTQIEDFVEKEYDIICINLVDRTDTSLIIDKTKAADIPVIFFNRELVPEDLDRWNQLYYVGANAGDSGKMEGQIIVDICEKDFSVVDKNKDGIIQYVMLEGEAGHQDAVLRTQQSIDTITEAGYKVEKLGDESANWKRAQAQSKMTQIINQEDNIEVVLANNDDMALGAIDAFKNSSRDIPIIVGIDGHAEALKSINSGELAGSVYNDNVGQAKAMLEIAYALGTDNEIPASVNMEHRTVRLPYEIVTVDNAQDFINR